MPELPDVELYRRRLDATALHRPIVEVTVNDARILADIPPEAFAARLRGNAFEHTLRHGKHLLVRLVRDGWMTMHFGMTGALVPFQDPADDPPYDRIRFDFADGHLAYTSRRMLGRVGLTDAADVFIAAEELGPDALSPEFDFATFSRALTGRRRDVKALLMDQSVLAGIGNIYSDEILFQAGLHPKTSVEQLDDEQRRRLFNAIKEVLQTAIDCGAGAEQFLDRLPPGYLLPQRRADGRCPRCGGPIATLKHQGRTAYFCPRCQPEPG